MLASMISLMIGMQTAVLTCEPLETDKRCRNYGPAWSAMVEKVRAGIDLNATHTLNMPPPQLMPMPEKSWSANSEKTSAWSSSCANTKASTTRPSHR